MKIRYQLTLLFTALVGSLLFIFCLAIYFFYSQFREREFFSRLEEKALYTIEIYDLEKNSTELLKLIDKKELTALYHEEITIFRNWNDVVYDSGEDSLQITHEQFVSVLNGKKLRIRKGETEILALRYDDEYRPYVIVASAIDKYGLSKMNTLFLILSSGWLFSIIFVWMAGYLFAGNALSPISDIISEAKNIQFSDLSARLTSRTGRDEISELVNTFNDMFERLQDALSMQRSFVSNASHELRNPLASLKAQLDVTLMQQRDSIEYEKVLKSVQEDINRLIKITNGLLELARVSEDYSLVKFSPIRIDETVLEAAEMVARHKPGYTFTLDYEKIPENDEDLLVLGSGELLLSALYNVIENGCKYSEDHKVAIKLVIIEDQIVLNLQDKGIGISPEDQKRIFEPFYRSENTREYAGIGLGLSLVQKIIKMHKGSLSIFSVQNYGTLVKIKLPKLKQERKRNQQKYLG